MNSRKFVRPLCRVTLFALAVAASVILFSHGLTARAQDLDQVTVEGRVVDENGAIIPGATVTAVREATNEERTVQANDDGRYRLIELPPGAYTVRASQTGFAVEEKRGLETVAGDNVKLDFTLKPASVTAEQVIISEADVSPVDTTRTVVGGTVQTEEVESLPNASRSPLDLIFTLGGVSEEPLSTRDLAEERSSGRGDTNAPANTPEEAGNFSLSGSPASSNNITIDGLDNNDDRGARERFQPSLESVAELQVITNQFSAEYGRASGGRVNIRTKAGAKKFQGRAFMFFRDDVFNANTYRNKILGLPRFPYTEYDPGFTLSGPLDFPSFLVGRGKTFFFVGYEYDKIHDTTLVDTLVPIQQNPLFPLPAPTFLAGASSEDDNTPLVNEIAPFISSITTPQQNQTLTVRIDSNYSDNHNGTISYQMGRLRNLRQFGGGNRLAEALVGRTRNTDAISYTDNFIFSAKVVNQARFQLSRLTPAVDTNAERNTPVVLISIDDNSSNPLFNRGTFTLVAGSSTTGASDRREVRYQIQDTFSWVNGSHSLRFGGDVQRIKSTFIDLSDVSGTFNFDTVADFIANMPNRFRQNFNTESIQQNTYLGFFVQDEWRIRPNFTLSAGLRYETETILDDRDNFGPRLAIAWDPLKSGKTVLRAGAGLFYNRVLLRTIDDFTLGTNRLFFDTNLLISPTTGLIMTDTERRDFIRNNLRFPEVLPRDSPLVRDLATTDTGFFRRLDPNIRIPESYQANVGFERELGGKFVFEANYTFNRGIHLFREFNANAPVLPAGFSNFTQYLLSRDFPNLVACPNCSRPIYNGATPPAGELVRFSAAANPTNTVGATVPEFGVNVTTLNLNNITSTNVLNAALDALIGLRPDPTRTQVEQLVSVGNSFYHGLVLELRRRFYRSKSGLGFSFRAAYTLSWLTDDGIVNTSSALIPGDFQRERSRSLLDRRHRFAFSGTFDTPRALGRIRFSPLLRLTSGAPFNISIGGDDRNLDDVGTDRPNFSGDLSLLRSRNPGDPLNPAILAAFSLPTIGQSGNLPRNAGEGPGQFILDLNITREFRVGERMRLRPVVEINNLLNSLVFSFGSEFINFNALSPTASATTRQNFLDTFLVPSRTLRPRNIRLGIRFDF